MPITERQRKRTSALESKRPTGIRDEKKIPILQEARPLLERCAIALTLLEDKGKIWHIHSRKYTPNEMLYLCLGDAHSQIESEDYITLPEDKRPTDPRNMPSIPINIRVAERTVECLKSYGIVVK